MMPWCEVNNPIEPAFPFGEVNSSTELWNGSFPVSISGKEYIGKGQAKLEIFPKPRIALIGYFDNEAYGPLLNCMVNTTPAEYVKIGEKMILSPFPSALSAGGGVIVEFTPHQTPVCVLEPDSTDIKQITFALYNFGDINCKTFRSTDSNHNISFFKKITLKTDKLSLEITSVSDLKDRLDKIRQTNGYSITHTALLEKEDGTPFNVKNANLFISSLTPFFSFIKGSWCTPVCPVGFDKLGKRVWESWAPPPSSPFQKPLSWLNTPPNEETLQTIFAGYSKCLQDTSMRETIYESLEWYVNSNKTDNLEANLILTQAALERLSYEFMVNKKKCISIKGFKDRLYASDRIRLLLSYMGIPLSIPKNILDSAGKNTKKWEDFPHALTEIRNGIVHPDKKESNGKKTIFHAWNAGMWVLEVIYLKAFGYSGKYFNRSSGYLDEVSAGPSF